jgi:hypothetical protein
MGQFQRLCDRFEIAVGNFGRSCIHSQSNEKAFQAWFAVSVIHEFGLSRVVREVHLDKKQLFTLIRQSPQFDASSIIAGFESGHELFPDLSVMWEPGIDTRHTLTRNTEYADAEALLPQIAVVTELKVTGSTGKPTPKEQIIKDLHKLAVFRSAHDVIKAGDDHRPQIATYLVVMDNYCNRNGVPRCEYSKERMAELMRSLPWPEHIQKPTVILLSPSKRDCDVFSFVTLCSKKGRRAWAALLTCSAVGAARGRAIGFALQAGLWREVAERVTRQTLTPNPSPLSTRARGARGRAAGNVRRSIETG